MKTDKKDKGDKILQRADRQAQRVAKKVAAASKKAEKTKQKQAVQAQKKAARAAKQATKKAAKTTNRADKAAKKAQLIAKKAEDKKAKAVAKAAKKAEGLPPEEGEGAGKKKKGKKKLLLLVVPVLAVAIGAGAFFFLRGGGEEEEEAPPPPIPIPGMYEIEGTAVSALPAWGENVLVYMEEILPEKVEGEEAEAEDEEAEEGFVPKLYRYEGLQAPAKLVAAYTALMISDDAGFSTVDDTLLRIDPPEFTGEESRGSVQLARNVPATEETKAGVQSLLLAWEGDHCTVSVETPEGQVHDPKPETPAGVAIVRRSLSDIKAMHPSVLGLLGDSMEEYDLLPQDGSVRIGNEPCQRINVYDHDSQFAGSYFLSSGGKLYKLDEASNGVIQLEWE